MMAHVALVSTETPVDTVGLREAETGATAVEYAVMLGLIAAVIIGAVMALGLRTEGLFADVLSRWP